MLFPFSTGKKKLESLEISSEDDDIFEPSTLGTICLDFSLSVVAE